ncbi:MAG TPA: galactokinase [Phycisphaerae bacterium]|nr:galactokinase [Phycisphaerae bacterium]
MTRQSAGVNESPAIAAFCRRFPGVAPTASIVVPGRVNLIGEHVDYCGGIVLPMAIESSLRILTAPASKSYLSVFSETHDEFFECYLSDLERPVNGWPAYVVGVARELRRRDVMLGGIALAIGGDIPIGAGLSSSAALCAGIAMAILNVAGVTLPSFELAILCQDAEHFSVGVPCGIMDPLVCLSARRDNALRIDCRTGESRHVPWPSRDLVAIVVDSRIRRELAEAEYAVRESQCRVAETSLMQLDPRVGSLRDLAAAALISYQDRLDPVEFRRARHVVTEINRADRATDALVVGDADLFGRLMNESHASLRDDFECCPPQIDDLATVVRDCSGVYGARMTGGGFGGCVVALARRAAMPSVEQAVRERYDRRYGVTAQAWCCTPCQGATLTPLDHP